MKTTKTLLLALAAMSTLAAQANAKGEESITVSKPIAAVQPADSGVSSKEAKITSLESRLAELEAMVEASNAKIAAIEKQVNPSPRVTNSKILTNSKTRGRNARR